MVDETSSEQRADPDERKLTERQLAGPAGEHRHRKADQCVAEHLGQQQHVTRRPEDDGKQQRDRPRSDRGAERDAPQKLSCLG